MTTPALAACTRDPDRQTPGRATTSTAPEPSSKPRGKILLAYFPRPG
ncbi:hypothetical protein [Streptomyces sp. NPDC002746]